MREGAARNVASGRPDFLGSQRESSANHSGSEVPTNTSFFALRRLPCLDPSRSPARYPASSGQSTAARPAITGHHDPQLRPRSDRDFADEAGQMIAGHGRLLAARELGLAEAPVIVLAGLSDPQVAGAQARRQQDRARRRLGSGDPAAGTGRTGIDGDRHRSYPDPVPARRDRRDPEDRRGSR